MNIRFIAAFTAMLLLGTMAAAQEYSIRANRGLNLRAAPSLSADVAGTVRSGAILEVVGESGRWLQIKWPGSEVWLANWVNYSRMDNSSQTPSQPETTAPVDNCCFVDRQCTTDQQWIDGYWAYQNNHCPAPAQTSASASAQSAGNAVSHVDNCCPPGAIIEGSEEFVARINAALELLRIRAPLWHAYVTKGPKKIAESHLGAPDGYATGDSIYISPSAAAKPAHVLAALLVHEACHVQRMLAGLFRYETEQQQNLEESLAGYLVGNMMEHINYGRSVMTYSPSQVARLIRDGKLEQRTGTGLWLVAYITREVGQLLREGIDVFGAVRAEIARANSLLS